MALKKELGTLEVFCIASGAMISSGLFILPGLAFAKAGPAVVFSYIAAGFLAATGLLSVVELATAMPKAGGDYFFVTRTFGAGAGTASGLLSWFALSLKSAFALVGMAEFARIVIPLPGAPMAIAFCLVFTGINLLGAREAGRAQTALVAGLIALLVLFAFRGLPRVDVTVFQPFAPRGNRAVFAAVGFVFVSYGGLLHVASVAEEVKNPGRSLPLGLFLSLIVVTGFYGLTVFITVGTLPGQDLATSLTPISDSAAVFMGKAGVIALSIAAVMAFVSTANAGIMAASRYPLALSRDRLIPEIFGRTNRRFETPYVAILFTSLVMIVVLLLPLESLVKAASSAIILANILTILATVILRKSKIQNYRPTFRVPLYPWLHVAGLLGFLFILIEMGRDALLFCLPLVVAGVAIYWFFGKRNDTRESALAHLVAEITNRRIGGRLLESELKEIIRERDEIVKDRFDELVEGSVVLDIADKISRDELFDRLGEALADRLGMKPDQIKASLIEREDQTSTIIAPGIAIPHIVLDGQDTFAVALVRCREGIVFREGEEPVRTVFVLAGTQDERNFHLRALTAIAQIVQSRDFNDRWLHASGREALRDLVLLTERSRK